MSEHVFDELPLLLSGEADRSTLTSAAAHLRGCEDCRQELIAAVVSHASLLSAVHYAPELAEHFPPAGADLEPAAELPDLSAMFAQIRAEAQPPPSVHRAHRTSVRWLLAAAAVVLVGGGATAAVLATHGSSTATQSVALEPYDRGTSAATVRLVDGREMKVDAASLPALGTGQYYEVWLTNAGRTSMAAVGQLNHARQGDFEVTSSVMATYSAVEVSVQRTSTTGSYSGVSVLRGSYS